MIGPGEVLSNKLVNGSSVLLRHDDESHLR
jgi:hypothetical protein